MLHKLQSSGLIQIAFKAIPYYIFFALLFLIMVPLKVSAEEEYYNSKSHIRADSVRYFKEDDKVIAEGNIELRNGEKIILGDYAEFNKKTGLGFVEGNVIIDDPENHIVCRKAFFDINSNFGTIYEASGIIASTYYFKGKELERIAEDRYKILEGEITTCCGDSPAWTIRAKKANLHMEKYAYLYLPSFTIKKIPVFYFPYFIFPIKTKRETGFLPPITGGGGKEGFTLINSFFIAINDSHDATITWERQDLRGNKYGLEYRYVLSRTAAGQFNGTYHKDYDPETQTEPTLWKIEYTHNQTLPYGIKGLIRVDQVSETTPERKFDIQNIMTRSRRSTDSYVSLAKNWESRSIQTIARRRVSTELESSEQFNEMPATTFTNTNEQLFKTPFYMNFEGSFKSFEKVTETNNAPKSENLVNRIHLSPAVSYPVSVAPWLSLTPRISYKDTFYSNGTRYKNFERSFYETGFSVSGPKFYRIFLAGDSSVKHLIEPEITFLHTSKIQNEANEQIIKFDDIDNLGAINDPANTVDFALTNILLKKSKSKEISEIVRFEAKQRVDIHEYLHKDEKGKPDRPFKELNLSVLTNIFPFLKLNYYSVFDVYQKINLSETYDIDINFPGKYYFTLERRTKKELNLPDPTSVTDIATLGFTILGKLKFEMGKYHDELKNISRENDYALTYLADCWEISFDLINRRFSPEEDSSKNNYETRFFFTVTLKDVLTYGKKGALGFIKRRF